MKIAEIELRKIANTLVYFANSTKDFGLTKANKLLYYLDCFHLLRHGRVVLRDKYFKNQLGPVPQETSNRLEGIRELNSLPEKDRQELKEREFMFEYLDIVSEPSAYYTLDRIVPHKDFEPKWFSKSEIEIMKELSEKYRNTTATELVRQTHKESPFLRAEMYDFIDLKLFLKDHNASQEYIEEVARTERLIDAIAANYQ